MTISMIAAGVLGLMLLFLSAYVIVGRVKFKVDLGDGGSEEMQRRIRVQANFVEYVPLALILIMLVEYGKVGPGWLPAALAVALVAGRVLHAYGLAGNAGTSVGRFVGTNLTALAILGGALAVLGRGVGMF
jgi:uncharacterized protein